MAFSSLVIFKVLFPLILICILNTSFFDYFQTLKNHGSHVLNCPLLSNVTLVSHSLRKGPSPSLSANSSSRSTFRSEGSVGQSEEGIGTFGNF